MKTRSPHPKRLATLTWTDPESGGQHEYTLSEGTTITIGRSSTNDITIADQHVSRQHAVVTYRDGHFLVSDLGSANGTYVNDERLLEGHTLQDGDRIRLYMPVVQFDLLAQIDEESASEDTPSEPFNTPLPTNLMDSNGVAELSITSGPQEGEVITLRISEVTVGRATSNATWEIGLQDPSVSRPHARLKRSPSGWILYDMNSVNGTFVNTEPVSTEGRLLYDGDVIAFGATIAVYRVR